MLVTHIVSLCVALRQTQTAIGRHIGVTVVGMSVTLTSGQMAKRRRDRGLDKLLRGPWHQTAHIWWLKYLIYYYKPNKKQKSNNKNASEQCEKRTPSLKVFVATSIHEKTIRTFPFNIYECQLKNYKSNLTNGRQLSFSLSCTPTQTHTHFLVPISLSSFFCVSFIFYCLYTTFCYNLAV